MLMKMWLRKCLQKCYINGELCSSSSSPSWVEIKFVLTLWSFQAKTFLWLLSPGIKLSSRKDNSIHVAKEKNGCCRSATKSCPTLCNPTDCSPPGFPVLHCLLEFAQTHVYELVLPSNHLILCHPLLLPSILPSIRVFSNEPVLRIRWPKYWSFSFSISPSNEYSGLISFRTVWFDLLTVQRTLKSLLQHHSSKASILQCSAFFTVQLSHPYMTTGNTIAWTIQILFIYN